MTIELQPGFFSLVFFIIELCLLIIAVIKNRDHPFSIIIFSIMALLQIYQLTEFLLCIGIDENVVGRIAITSITLLPPAGYFLSVKLSNWRFREYWIVLSAGIAFSLYYILLPNSISLVSCNPFYAIYSIPSGILYGVYYFGIILLSILLIAIQFARKNIRYGSKGGIGLLVGFLSFLIPMGLTVLIESSTIIAIPSIMCKYAILLAITLFWFSFKK